MAKYIALKKIDVLRENKEGKKDFLGTISMDVVQTIELGQELEAREYTRQTYSGIIGNYMQTVLALPNGGHVQLSDAVLSSEYEAKRKKELELAKVQMEIAKLPTGVDRDKLQAELNRASERNLKLYIGLGIVALVIGYFAYKKFNS